MVDEEEVYIIKKALSKYDKPLFPSSISTKSHLIFLKYTSPKYRTYMLNQYKFLCNKLHNNVNKHEIYYLSILFNDLILFNCENDPIITNISLLVFCCFYISVKFRLNQYEVMSIKSLKKFNPEKFNEYSNEEIQYVETLCLKLLNYKLNYMTCYDYLVILVYKYGLKKKIIDYSYDILYQIIVGDLKEYIFKSPLKVAQEAIFLAKEKYYKSKENESNDIDSNINNNKTNNLNSNSNNKAIRTSSLYHKISKYINCSNDKNNKLKYNYINSSNNNNNLVNNNTISTNSSSINKNNGYGIETGHQFFNDNTSENISKKQFGRINHDLNNLNKQVFMEPLYSISSSKIANNLNNLNSNKKRNNSVIMDFKYEIKASQVNNYNTKDECERENSIKKKDIKKIINSNYKIDKNEQNNSRYLINVNLAKRKHNKIQSLNDFSAVKMSLSNSKKNQICSSFMRDNLKNMKSLLQFSNRHNHNNTNNK
jgi:hypothetical protein